MCMAFTGSLRVSRGLKGLRAHQLTRVIKDFRHARLASGVHGLLVKRLWACFLSVYDFSIGGRQE